MAKKGAKKNSPQNVAYKLQNRKRKNKIRKLKALLKKQPNNLVIEERLQEIIDNPKYGEKK